jgi:hypothetical protein
MPPVSKMAPGPVTVAKANCGAVAEIGGNGMDGGAKGIEGG